MAHLPQEVLRQALVGEHRERARFFIQAVRPALLDCERLHGFFQAHLQGFPDVGEAARHAGHGVEQRKLPRAIVHALLERLVRFFQLHGDPLARGQGDHVPGEEALEEDAHGEEDEGQRGPRLYPGPRVQGVRRLREPSLQETQARKLAEGRELEQADPEAQIAGPLPHEDDGNGGKKHEVQPAASHEPHPGEAGPGKDVHQPDEQPRADGDGDPPEKRQGHESRVREAVREEQRGQPAAEVGIHDSGQDGRQTADAHDDEDGMQGQRSPLLEICLREKAGFPADCQLHVLLILRPAAAIRKRGYRRKELLGAFALAHERVRARGERFVHARRCGGKARGPGSQDGWT